MPGSKNNVLNRPAYSVAEAARYLHLNPTTLQTWALGRTYPTVSGNKVWLPLFIIADHKRKLLSFTNLVEASVLSAVRRDHGVKMQSVRDALDFVKTKLGVSRPLADEKFATDGASMFVQRYGDLINVSKSGQQVLRGMLDQVMQRIERSSPGGVPIRLFPTLANSQQRSEFVAFDPRIAFGRPVLASVGVPISAVANRFRGGDSIDVLAKDYDVGATAIEEAIRQADILHAA